MIVLFCNKCYKSNNYGYKNVDSHPWQYNNLRPVSSSASHLVHCIIELENKGRLVLSWCPLSFTIVFHTESISRCLLTVVFYATKISCAGEYTVYTDYTPGA